MELEERQVIVPEDAAGERLDRVLAELLSSVSRTQIQRQIAAGRVSINGEPAAKPSQPLAAGQKIVVQLPEQAPPQHPEAEAIALEVLHEDDQIVVVDKPPGMVMHPGAGHPGGTLVNGLLHRYGESLSTLGGRDRPGIVHRLDKGTSGVIVVARDDEAHRLLSDQFANRSVDKEYDAFVYGTPKERKGKIDLALGRDRLDRTKISADTDKPRPAMTGWELQQQFRSFSRLWLWPLTGRTHQVRAHLAAIHHPCIGDAKYAGAQWKGIEARWLRDAVRRFPRPALHASRLIFEHPATNERMEFQAPLPEDLRELYDLLQRS